MKGRLLATLFGGLNGAAIGGFVSCLFLSYCCSKIGLDLVELYTRQEGHKWALLFVILQILVPLGALLGAGLFYLWSRLWRVMSTDAWVNIFVVFPLVQFLCGVVLWQALPRVGTSFLSMRWKVAVDTRRSMLDDLVSHYQLKNVNRKAVENLLGPSELPMFLPVRRADFGVMDYRLGGGDCLEFTFERSSNMIREYKVRRFQYSGAHLFEPLTVVPTLLGKGEKKLNGERFLSPWEVRSIEFKGKKLANQAFDDQSVRRKLKLKFGGDDCGCELNIPGVGVVNQTNAVELDDGRVFLVGHLDSANSEPNRIWIVDLKTNAIVNGPKVLPARFESSVLRLRDGRVLIAGGTEKLYEDNSATSICQLYDPATNSLSHAGNLIIPRRDANFAVLNNGDVLFVGGMTAFRFANTGGGYPEDRYTTSVELFSPAEGDKHTYCGAMRNVRNETIVVPYDSDQALIVCEAADEDGSIIGRSASIFKGVSP